MLLQLVEPNHYEKFCSDTIVVICNVLDNNGGGDQDSMFELDFSMNGDDDYRQLEMNKDHEDSQKKKQELLDMIDRGINDYRASESNMYDEMSMDDARSMVESLQGKEEVNEDENDIIAQTKALLAGLKDDQ